MASDKLLKICEVEGNACKKDVQALCYHCSKNLCRIHLMQHAQLIEEQTRAELNSLVDKLNELSSRFNNLSISDDVLQKPFDQLEKWRVEAHEKIDRIAENKRQELKDQLDKYKKDFFSENEEQLVKLNASKKTIAELIQEGDASATQIADLQGSIDEAEKYLNALNVPVINVIAQPSKWFVNICTSFSDTQSVPKDKIREFKITYVRQNGIIRTYYIKTKENGKMSDLIKSFVGHCTAIEEFIQIETNQIYTIDHVPKLDFILSVEVYNHNIHLVYTGNSLLSHILDDDVIVFYETPYSLSQPNNPRILMPCLFQHKLEKRSFGLPIYLNVPRQGCRGQDVRDSLHGILGKFFRCNLNTRRPSYDTYLQSTVDYSSKKVELDGILEDEIDFTKTNASIIVTFDDQFIGEYERSCLEQFSF